MNWSNVVNCCEKHAAITEVYGTDGIQAAVTLMCAWADRHALVEDILSNFRQWPYGNFVVPPYATSASIRPLDSKATTDGQSLVYDLAEVTINFSTRQGDDPEQLFSEAIEPTAEFLTLDPEPFRWSNEDGDILLPAEAPGRLLRGLNIVRTTFKVQAPLPASILSAVGHVNSAPVTASTLGLTLPAETLLYTPPNLSRTVTTQGAGAFNIVQRWTYKPEGWNKFWRAATQAYEEIYDTRTDSVYKNYPLFNFALLP